MGLTFPLVSDLPRTTLEAYGFLDTDPKSRLYRYSSEVVEPSCPSRGLDQLVEVLSNDRLRQLGNDLPGDPFDHLAGCVRKRLSKRYLPAVRCVSRWRRDCGREGSLLRCGHLHSKSRPRLRHWPRRERRCRHRLARADWSMRLRRMARPRRRSAHRGSRRLTRMGNRSGICRRTGEPDWDSRSRWRDSRDRRWRPGPTRHRVRAGRRRARSRSHSHIRRLCRWTKCWWRGRRRSPRVRLGPRPIR